MARKTPTVSNSILEIYDENEGQVTIREDIATRLGWAFWQRFLGAESTKSFRYVYINAQGFKLTFTGIKEKHPHGWFWYGHKRVNKKLRKKYLGKNANLTIAKLQETAEYLSQGRLV